MARTLLLLFALPLSVATLPAAVGADDPPPSIDAAKADLFVAPAPAGDDAWSGRLSAANDAKTDGPFATLDRARQAVRAIKSGEPNRTRPIVVAVRGGTHALASTLIFEPEDSGTNPAPIIWAAFPGETPVISGGSELRGWNADDQGRWTVTLPEVAAGAWNFSQLWVDGARRYRPRLPKTGYYFVLGELPPTPRAGEKGDDRFTFRPGEIRADWHGLADVEVLNFHQWTMSRMRVEAVDEAKREVRFTGTTRGLAAYAKFIQGHRYLVENVREALTDPGEWYLDRASGLLTYIPMPGEEMAKARVVAPRLEQLVILKGDPAARKFVSNVRFQGLAFAHTNWNSPPEGNSFPQAEAHLSAAIQGIGVRDVALNNCTVAHIGNYAIEAGPGSKRVTIDSCVLADTGGGGVKVGELVRRDDDEMVASHVTVTNSQVLTGGRMLPAAIGVFIGHAHSCKVVHTTIRDYYYTGISVGWSWGYNPTNNHDNIFEKNHVFQIGQGVLSDMGALYSLGLSPGTVLRGNRFHDVTSFDYGGWGIYFDEGSTGIIAEGNVVYRCKTGNFHQHYGKDNVLRDNVLVDSPGPQIVRSRSEPHRSFTFTRNVVAYAGADATLLGSNWNDDDRYVIDENLYWNGGKPVTFGGLDLEAWRKRGHDRNSVVADPKFLGPKQDDYRLAPDSPAITLGIKPPDVRDAGSTIPDSALKAYLGAPRAFPPPPPPQPPSPIIESFESYEVGVKPVGVSVHEESSQASVRVTDTTAADGKRSLRLTDAPGQKARFNPHLFWKPGFDSGVIEGRFAVRVGPGVEFNHEWRDKASPYRVGPSLWARDGVLLASGQKITTIPTDQWVRVRIVTGLGDQARGTYSLTIDTGKPGEAPVHRDNLPCDPNFKRLDWYGFTSNADTATLIELDDVNLAPRP
jgi:hypothetical protein